MDNTTKQQLLYAVTAMNFWLQKGWTVWDFSGNEPNVIVDELNETAINVGKVAVDFKRKEKYAEALGAYIHLINACLKKTGKIPVVYVRGLYKVLVCINAFKTAFDIVSTILADMEQSSYVNQQEKQVFESYFNGLIYLSIQVIDANDFSNVAAFAANYSGNPRYMLFQSNFEIKDEFKRIREQVRQMYGQ